MAETKGILGTKLGMTQIFDDTRAVPVTVIKAGPCVVSQVKTKDTDKMQDILQGVFKRHKLEAELRQLCAAISERRWTLYE